VLYNEKHNSRAQCFTKQLQEAEKNAVMIT